MILRVKNIMNNNLFDKKDSDIAWCPGCGNFSILTVLKSTLAELDITPQKLVLVSGIGQAAKIGKGVFLGAHTILSDNNKMIRDVKYDLLGPTIEDFVRVGINCMILSNVIVGKYSLIGASSVVTKNISERSLAYGNPARVVQELKQEEINEYVNSIK